MADKKEMKVFGATILGFVQACVNLRIVAGSKVASLGGSIELAGWYPFELLRQMERAVLESYENAAPIMERVGMQMMLTWYDPGPGKEIIKRGVDFLHFQTGSQGYASVVQGPERVVGSFSLTEIDEKNGKAVVHSTTLFDKDLERGVLIGGMKAPGDLDYIGVNNDEDRQCFRIEFH